MLPLYIADFLSPRNEANAVMSSAANDSTSAHPLFKLCRNCCGVLPNARRNITVNVRTSA